MQSNRWLDKWQFFFIVFHWQHDSSDYVVSNKFKSSIIIGVMLIFLNHKVCVCSVQGDKELYDFQHNSARFWKLYKLAISVSCYFCILFQTTHISCQSKWFSIFLQFFPGISVSTIWPARFLNLFSTFLALVSCENLIQTNNIHICLFMGT